MNKNKNTNKILNLMTTIMNIRKVHLAIAFIISAPIQAHAFDLNNKGQIILPPQVNGESIGAACFFTRTHHERDTDYRSFDSDKHECFTPQTGWQNMSPELKNKASSIRIYGNLKAEVANGDNGSGSQRRNIMKDVYQLDSLDNNINSVQVSVQNDPFVCFHEHVGFNGTPECYSMGESVSNMVDNNSASSLFISDYTAVQVKVYRGSSYSSDSRTLYRSYGSLSDDSWNDDINSIQVQPYEPTTSSAEENRFGIDLNTRMDRQEELSNYVPLARGSWKGTHNSYNVDDYLGHIPFGANQFETVTQQLELRSRLLEFDAHNSGNDPQFWHTPTPFDKVDVSRMFSEVRDWIRAAGDNDFLILKIEDHVDGDARNHLATVIEDAFGDLVYRPSDVPGHVSRSCESIFASSFPTTKDLIVSGKRIVLMSFECDGSSNLVDYVFQYTGSEPNGSSDFSSHGCGDVSGFVLSNDGRRPIDSSGMAPHQIRPALKCVNAVAHDRIEFDHIGRGRQVIDASTWAWFAETNMQEEGRVAFILSTVPEGDQFGTFVVASQQYASRKILCRNSAGSFRVTNGFYSFEDAANNCGLPGEDFSVPVTAIEAEAVRKLMLNQGIYNIWVDYEIGSEASGNRIGRDN